MKKSGRLGKMVWRRRGKRRKKEGSGLGVERREREPVSR